MNRIKTPVAGKIHSRAIDVATYPLENGKIIVEGFLKDNRYCQSHLMTGEVTSPGVLHHMVIRMLVSAPQLVIEDLEVEMPQAPREECQKAESSLQPIVGMAIRSGFTSRVKKAVGGPAGCSHLLALLLAMAPAVVQGYWSDTVRKPYKPEDFSRQAMEIVLDTCHVWRSDGPVAREYREKYGVGE